MKFNKLKRAFNQHINKWHSSNSSTFYGYKYGLVCNGYKYLTKNQLEACRKVISRFIKQTKPKAIVKTFVNYYIYMTKKAIGSRMGKGKGSVNMIVSKSVPNSLLFVFKNIKKARMKIIINKLGSKLPVKLKLISYYKNGYCRYKNRCIR